MRVKRNDFVQVNVTLEVSLIEARAINLSIDYAMATSELSTFNLEALITLQHMLKEALIGDSKYEEESPIE